MRFLSKGVACAIMFVVISIISFLCINITGGNSVNFNLAKNPIANISVTRNKLKADDVLKAVDDTVFNLHYDDKIWTFRAKDFEIDSNVFSIAERINRHSRNGSRANKIQLINKLIDVNITQDVAFNYVYYGFNKKLNKIEKNINKLPQNAEIIIKNNRINIKNEIIGVKLDKYLFYKKLIEQYIQGDKIININIPVIESKPKVTAEMLKKYTYKRGEFSTSIASSSSGRKYNIRKALNAINGTHLSKTEKFSFNDCVGRRSADRGYKNAKIILDGEFVEGVGGGVCQVSSTLYNAVLLSGLNVVKSQKHSQRVGYVKAGFDAMVNYGTSDLIFENNTEGDVYILCKYTDSQISISVYGSNLGNVKYDRQCEIVSPVSAGEQEIVYDNDGKYLDKVVYEDECFELKKARDGYTIKSYRIKYIDGQEVGKELLRSDKYLPQHSVLVYGVKKRENDILSFNNISETLLKDA